MVYMIKIYLARTSPYLKDFSWGKRRKEWKWQSLHLFIRSKFKQLKDSGTVPKM
jgi:hypothetical protein